MATSYARIKHRILTVMGDEEGGAVMEYIDTIRSSSNKKTMEPKMTDTKELEQLIRAMRGKGRLVLVKYTYENGRTLHDTITVLNTPEIGDKPMSPIYAAEAMRKYLAN